MVCYLDHTKGTNLTCHANHGENISYRPSLVLQKKKKPTTCTINAESTMMQPADMMYWLTLFKAFTLLHYFIYKQFTDTLTGQLLHAAYFVYCHFNNHMTNSYADLWHTLVLKWMVVSDDKAFYPFYLHHYLSWKGSQFILWRWCSYKGLEPYNSLTKVSHRGTKNDSVTTARQYVSYGMYSIGEYVPTHY